MSTPKGRARWLRHLPTQAVSGTYSKFQTRCHFLEADDHSRSVGDGPNGLAVIVVSCHDIHSAVRAPQTNDNPNHSGITAYSGLVPIAEIEDRWRFDMYLET